MPLRLLSVIWIIASRSVLGADVWEGVLPDEPLGSACQADYLIVNACDLENSGVLLETTLDLEPLRCEYVRFEGIEVFDPRTGCTSLQVDSATVVEPPCTLAIRALEFRHQGNGPSIHWEAVPCSVWYDVVRGRVERLTDGELGQVDCLADDLDDRSLDETLIAVDPEPGGAFFFLVRAQGPFGLPHYGQTTSGAERRPAAGDCTVLPSRSPTAAASP